MKPLCPSTRWWPLWKGSFQWCRIVVHETKFTNRSRWFNNFSTYFSWMALIKNFVLFSHILGLERMFSWSTYFTWMPRLKNIVHFSHTLGLQHMFSWSTLCIPKTCAWRWKKGWSSTTIEWQDWYKKPFFNTNLLFITMVIFLKEHCKSKVCNRGELSPKPHPSHLARSTICCFDDWQMLLENILDIIQVINPKIKENCI